MARMPPIRVFAPAKVNLALHVTGQRADGYHLLDTLVAFADTGDWLTLTPGTDRGLSVSGPESANLPAGADNLVLRAAALSGLTPSMTLEKHLPISSGIGGGSADAAAALRGLAKLGAPPLAPDKLLALGADLPMCFEARPARVRGIGERITPVAMDFTLPALLVNPRVAISTPAVFNALTCKENPAMARELPIWQGPADLIAWLAGQRNDLAAPAIAMAGEVAEVLGALEAHADCLLARMSGSGATCFGLFASMEAALRARGTLRAEYPGWWIEAAALGDQSARAQPA